VRTLERGSITARARIAAAGTAPTRYSDALASCDFNRW
jgi:hypothetical protein